MKQNKKTGMIYLLAFMIVGLLFLIPWLTTSDKEQYDMIFLGDSIIGNVWDENSIPNMVGEGLGKSAFNGAFGGTTLSLYDQNLWGSVTGIQWNLVKLTEAAAYDDWKSQLSAIAYADSYSDVNALSLSYFSERMQQLSKVDFAQAEYLIIEHGTNDYNCGQRLDNPEDAYDITTFGGALRYALRIWQEKYPQLEIVLVTPIYCEMGENYEQKCYREDLGYGTLTDYVELEKEIAADFGVTCIDAYHESGIWEENAAEMLTDGLHLSEEGKTVYGNFLLKKLRSIYE